MIEESYLRRILVVNKDPVVGVMISGILNGLGYYAASVTDNVEALKLLEEQSFELILAGPEMPSIGGYRLARAIRASQADFRHIPIIGMTFRARARDIIRAKKAGINRLTSVVKGGISSNLLKQLASSY